MINISSPRMFICALVYFSILLLGAKDVRTEQLHHTTRCICKCNGNESLPTKAIYVESPFLNKSKCTCPEAIMQKINYDLIKPVVYCLGCDCRYETRSLRKIQISVAIVIVVALTLVSYALCLVCLLPIFKQQSNMNRTPDICTSDYVDQENIENYETFGFYDSLGEHTDDFSPHTSRSRYVFDESIRRIVNIQTKWKTQLEIQRSKIYD